MHGASVSWGSVLIAELKVKVKVSICIWLISSMFFHKRNFAPLRTEPISMSSKHVQNIWKSHQSFSSILVVTYRKCVTISVNWDDEREQISNEIGFIWVFLTRLFSTVQSLKWIRLTFTTQLICQIKLYRILKQGSNKLLMYCSYCT